MRRNAEWACCRWTVVGNRWRGNLTICRERQFEAHTDQSCSNRCSQYCFAPSCFWGTREPKLDQRSENDLHKGPRRIHNFLSISMSGECSSSSISSLRCVGSDAQADSSNGGMAVTDYRGIVSLNPRYMGGWLKDDLAGMASCQNQSYCLPKRFIALIYITMSVSKFSLNIASATGPAQYWLL